MERMVLRHSIVLNITIVKQKKLKKRGTHSTCQRLGNSLLLFRTIAVLTGSPVPTMHRWSQFGGQRCASNVHETGVDVGEGGMSYEARMQALRACVFR